MKKIIALFLSLLVIMAQSVNVFAWTLSDEDGNIIGNQTPEIEEEVDDVYEKWDVLEFMYAIGAFDENTISYSMLDDKIDKITFVSAVAGIYFNGASSTGIPKQIFSDVPENHYAATDVARLADMGVISGKGDATLGAEDDVSLDMAYAVVVRMVGYGQYAEAFGDYPKGSNEVARKLDITIDTADKSAITTREAVQLLYNALDAKMLLMTGTKGDEYRYEQGETFLEVQMGITKKRGIVYAAGAAALSGKTVGENKAIIGSEILSDPESYACDYLGYNTEYFINEDEELVWIMPYRTAEKTIYTDEDISYKDGYLYHGTDKVKKEKISIDEISILYNGIAASSINELVPAYGEVKLIDNDRDNAYEVAIVYDYDVYYLSSMSKDKSELRLEAGSKTVVKNLDNYDNVTLLDENGEELGSLKIKNVVMVAENGKSIRVIQCKQSVSGTITAITSEDAKKYWTLDDEQIKTADTVYCEGWDGKTLQQKINVYLDKYGNIAAAFIDEDGTQKEWKIGWLLKITEDEAGDKFYARIADSEYADSATYQFDDKFKVDGAQANLSKGYDPKNVITERGVVRYLVAEDKIKALDFPEYRSFAEKRKIADDEYNKLYKRMSGKRYFVESQGTLVKNDSSLAGDGNIYFSSDSVIYDAPERGKILTASAEDIAIVRKGVFVDHNYYEVDAYTIGGNRAVTDVLTVYGHNLAAGSTASAGAAMVITKIVEGLDADDGPTKIITGYVMGQKEEYMISENGLRSDASNYATVTSLSSVKPGDVVKFTTDRYKRIDWLQKIWGGDGVGYVNKYGWTGEDIFGMYRYVDAHVVSYSDGVLGYNVSSNGSFEMNRIGDAPVYVYNRSEERANAYKPASKQDLELAASNPELYETVLVGSYHTLTKEVILIKK